MSRQRTIFDRNPLYVVLFQDEQDSSTAYHPLIKEVVVPGDLVTVPHACARNVAAALPGLWYCLHLPNTFFDLTGMPAQLLKAGQAIQPDHHIALVPIQRLSPKFISWASWTAPVLVLCPDSLYAEASERSSDMGFALDPARFSQLSNETLKEHWRAIHNHFIPSARYLGREPALPHRLDLSATTVPACWLARHLRTPQTPFVVDDKNEDPFPIVYEALRQQVFLTAYANLEKQGVPDSEVKHHLQAMLDQEGPRLSVPATIALPGVSAPYARHAYSPEVRERIQPLSINDRRDTWTAATPDRSDMLVERSMLEFATARQAISRGGVGLLLPSIPPPAFTTLAQLERHCKRDPKGAVVWKLLRDLDRATQTIWSETLKKVVSCASSLTVFSTFPLGLLRMPGDTAPLACRLPISYRPIVPLTRAIEIELASLRPVYFGSRLKVLVAECINPTDPAGIASRDLWNQVEEHLGDNHDNIQFTRLETQSVSALRAAIGENTPHILVLSAHGEHKGNIARIIVGGQRCTGPELGRLPPMVILSACNVAPRGAGAISIADLFLLQGAFAVLGTQVPVRVQHNANLMLRFFLYIAEGLAQRRAFPSLLEAWHEVQVSNAVNDIKETTGQLNTWLTTKTSSGHTNIVDFMDNRSPGRLRTAHVYQDTELILGEMADQQGIGGQVRNWFRSPGYVPESLFYLLVGRPDRILLQPPTSRLGDAATPA